jgi:hypothetical protein
MVVYLGVSVDVYATTFLFHTLHLLFLVAGRCFLVSLMPFSMRARGSGLLICLKALATLYDGVFAPETFGVSSSHLS